MHWIRTLSYTVILLFACLVSGVSFAQVGPENPPPNPCNGGPCEDVPITGIEWLLLGGGLLGAKKVYDLRKKGK